MKKFLFSLLLLILTFLAPTLQAKEDFPQLSGHVVDEAHALTAETKIKLNNLLASDKDNQVVVAVLKDLRGKEGREYGLELARHWKLGQQGKDNGVLILMSPQDRYVGIEVGYGLEDILTDNLTGRILQKKVLPPLLQNKDYNAAMLEAATAVMSVISDPETAKQYQEDDLTLEDILSMIFVLIMVYMVLSGKTPRGGGNFPGGGFSGGGRSRGGFFGGGGSFGGGGAGRRF